MGRGKPSLGQHPIVTHVDGPEPLKKAVEDYTERTGMSKKALTRWALAMWAERMGYGHICVPSTIYTRPEEGGDGPPTAGIRPAESYIEDGYPQ